MVMPNISPGIGYLSANKAEGINQKGNQVSGGFELMLASLKSSTKAFTGGLNAKPTEYMKKTDIDTQPQEPDVAQSAKKTDTESQIESVAGSVKPEQTSKTSEDSLAPTDTVRDESMDLTENESLDESVLERISALLSLVSELIMDKLELNADEFNKLLEDLNMTAVDLLEPGSLQMLVLAGSNEDNVLALLTNEKLASLMKELNLQLADLMDEEGIPQDISIDELKELLANENLKEVKDADVQKDTSSDAVDVINADNRDIINENAEETRFASDKKSLAAEYKNSDTDGKAAVGTESVQESKSAENTAADSQSQESDMAEQSSFQAFVDKLVNSVAGSASAVEDNAAIATGLRDIAYQIIEKIRVSVTPDQTSLQINLNPENLGRVNLTIQAKEGIMTARFIVENQVSKEAIESQLNILRETLNQQGVKVDAIEVTVAAYAFDQNNSNSEQNRSETGKQNTGRHITIEEAMAMFEEEAFDDRLAANLATSDNQINYIA